MPTAAALRRYQRRSPADKLARSHYWRAKRKNGNRPNGFWPGVWWERLIAETNSTCQYCNQHTDRPSPDHATALSKGGTNEWYNIRLVCPTCQAAKGAMSEAAYRALLAAQKEKDLPMSSKAAKPQPDAIDEVVDAFPIRRPTRVVRNLLKGILLDLRTAYNCPGLDDLERDAMSRLAALSLAMYGDRSRLPRAVRRSQLREELDRLDRDLDRVQATLRKVA